MEEKKENQSHKSTKMAKNLTKTLRTNMENPKNKLALKTKIIKKLSWSFSFVRKP